MQEIKLHLKPDPHDPEADLVFVAGLLGEEAIQLVLDTGAARTWLPAGPGTADLDRIGPERSSGLFAEEEAEMVRVRGCRWEGSPGKIFLSCSATRKICRWADCWGWTFWPPTAATFNFPGSG